MEGKYENFQRMAEKRKLKVIKGRENKFNLKIMY